MNVFLIILLVIFASFLITWFFIFLCYWMDKEDVRTNLQDHGNVIVLCIPLINVIFSLVVLISSFFDFLGKKYKVGDKKTIDKIFLNFKNKEN